MPIPIATQPNPARKPAVAPQAMSVLGALRNIARLNDMMRLKMKLMPKTLAGESGGGSSLPNPLARFQALWNSAGEYQSPPSRKAERAATRMAHTFRVCMFMEI